MNLDILPTTFLKAVVRITALIHVLCLCQCRVSGAGPLLPMDDFQDRFSLVPSLRVSPIDSHKEADLSARTLERFYELGARPISAEPIAIAMGQYTAAAEMVRRQLEERYETNHLLYLGSTSSGLIYAFPLVGTNGQAIPVAASNHRIHMALLEIQHRPHDDRLFRDRTISFHGILGVDAADNANIILQRLMGAVGVIHGRNPVTHDLHSLFSNRIPHF